MPTFFFLTYTTTSDGPPPFVKRVEYDDNARLQEVRDHFGLTRSCTFQGAALDCTPPHAQNNKNLFHVVVRGPEALDHQLVQTIIMHLLQPEAKVAHQGQEQDGPESRVLHWLDTIHTPTSTASRTGRCFAGPHHPFATFAKLQSKPYDTKR
jgi:hypothetical protein